VESHLVVNGQKDMPIGVCSDVAFTNGTGSKARPVLVLGESGNFTHICSLTSKNYTAPGKVPLAHTASTNLFHRTSASFVHTQWLTTVPSQSVSLYGTLDSRDKSDVLTALRARYSNIMTVVEKHDRAPVPESKPAPVFKPRKDGIDLEAGVANREEAAGVVAKYYTEICAMVRSEVVRNKMYSLFSSGGLEPHDFVAMAMKNFMAPNSKSDVPATVGGVFAYFTVAAVNRARDVGRKVARAQSVRDYREIDEIDEREHCNLGNSAMSDIEASERADHILTSARAAASTRQMQDALASIEMHAIDGPDEDALYLTDNVRDEYHPSTARLAEVAGMTPAQFIRQKKLIQKSIRLCLQHDPQVESGEFTLAARAPSKQTSAHEVKSIA